MNLGVELGDRVRDRISGLHGIVIGITDWLFNCRRVTVQPEESKDGKPADSFCTDEPQLEIVQKQVIERTSAPGTAIAPRTTGGPRDDARRISDVSRF